jgi:hypothetical protein
MTEVEEKLRFYHKSLHIAACHTMCIYFPKNNFQAGDIAQW